MEEVSRIGSAIAMKSALPRHLLSIAVLPFVMAVVVPLWVARTNAVRFHIGTTAGEIAIQILGVGVGAIGVLLFVSSLRRFANEGDGTLAPWDPPRRLVVRGPYRYVRNPMISGVIFIQFAEALVLLSKPHAMWALTFLAANFIYIPLLEEPQLKSRFGDEYAEYCRHVPRLIPRLSPYEHP
jgi:protein-S-isoprenylcysteine O-methyltransferase Ste14